MGTGCGVPAATILLLFLQLLTHRSTVCMKVENKSTTETRKENAPSTQKILVEEIILAGGVNNSEIPGDTIIEDPGKTKEKILSHLVGQRDEIQPKQQGRVANKHLAKASTNTLIINVADMKDLENLEHILAANEYEPRKIQSKKMKRKISQVSAVHSKPIDSSTEEAKTTTPEQEKFIYELPRKHRLKKKRKELNETRNSSTDSGGKSSLTSRRFQEQRSTTRTREEEKNNLSTTPAVTTQRVKRRLKKDDAAGSLEDPITPIPYFSLLAALKNPSRRTKNSANLSTAARSRNNTSSTAPNSSVKEAANRTLVPDNHTVFTGVTRSSSTERPRIAEETKEIESTAFATSSHYSKITDVGKNPDGILASNKDKLVTDSTTVATKKKKKRRKVPQHNTHVNIIDSPSNGVQKNENLTSNLTFLSKHDMIPRPFSVSRTLPSSLSNTGSASEASQTQVKSPRPKVNSQFGKSSLTNILSENSTHLPILEVTRNPHIVLNPPTTIPGLRSNLYPALSPVEEETQNSLVFRNNFDVRISSTDVPKTKTDPVAAFVNDLTSMSFGITPRTSILSGARNLDNTANLNNYVNQEEHVSSDLFNINDNPAVISLLALSTANPRIHAAESFNNVPINTETYERTLEPIKQANEYYLQPIQKLPATAAPILPRGPAEESEEGSGRLVNPEVYNSFAVPPIPSTQKTLAKDTITKYSDEPLNEDFERSKNPAVELNEGYDDGSSAAKFIPTKDQTVLDPYVTSTSHKNVISRANFVPTSNRAYPSSRSVAVPAKTVPRSLKNDVLRSENGGRRKLNHRNDDEDSAESAEDSESSEETDADYRSGRRKQQAVANRQAYKVHEAPEENRAKEHADTEDYEENDRHSERGDHQEERYQKHPRSEKRYYHDKYGQDQKQDYGNDSREKRKREYQDQKQERSERHHQHDRGAKDDKQKDEKFEKGGGTEVEDAHHSAEGSKGEKAYESEHEHEKQEKGHHDKEHHSNQYAEDDGEASKHHEEGGYHKEHHEAEKGEKKAEYEEKGEHKKGHSTKGAHVVHKKDEFEKKTEFFDEFHEDSDTEKEGEFHHEHEREKGGYEKHHKLEASEHEEGHGKKGEHMKGGHHDEHVGHEVKEDQDNRHEHEEKHGKKAGEEKGEKWSFKQRDGGGGKKKEGDE